MKLSLFSNLGVLSSIPVGRMMVAFDMTYLLQISGQHYNRKTDTANLVGGAWTAESTKCNGFGGGRHGRSPRYQTGD